MANTIPSIYMSMPVPVPTVQVGPQWATDINSCLTILDQHTHSSGSGQQITPAGISINQDLPYYNNNATLVRSLRFQAQPTPISQPTDLRCLYASSADLYYNDSAGNQVRITQNGGIAGTPGSITNLVSPASVAYISGSQTFVFQSSTATPANIDVGAITIREIVANSKGITLAPPAGLANNYSLAFPATLPSTGSQIVSSDSAGNLSFVSNYGVDNSTIQLQLNSLSVKDRGITTAKLSQVVPSTSQSCGLFSTTSTSYVDVTNLSVTLTTSGRPIAFLLQNDGTNTNSRIQTDNQGSGQTPLMSIQVLRNTTRVYECQFGMATNDTTQILVLPPSVYGVDFGPLASSAYTYKVQIASNFSNKTAFMVNVALFAYEI